MFIQARHTPQSAWLGHIPFAAWLIEVTKPRILVELGTHHGASYLAFCQAVETCGSPTKCYAVDTWQGDEHAGEYGDEVFHKLADLNNNQYGDFSRLLRMRFDEALSYFDGGEIDILHIDGFHSYEAVRNDFETWSTKLSDRAVVLFHDINVREREFGVWRFWAEIKGQYPNFEFTHTHGLGVLLVGSNQPDALGELCHDSQSPFKNVLINRLFEHLGRVITRTVDIGSLVAEQARLGAQLHARESEADALRTQVLEHQRSKDELAVGLTENVRLSAEFEALRVQVLECQRSKESLELCLVESKRLNSEIELLNRELAEQLNTQETLRNKEAALSGELTEVTQTLQEARREAALLRSTYSWRITKPLRAIRRIFV